MNCPDCKHSQHEPGRCSSCNCGESEISRTTSCREITTTGGDSFNGSTLTRYGYDMGHVVPKRRAA